MRDRVTERGDKLVTLFQFWSRSGGQSRVMPVAVRFFGDDRDADDALLFGIVSLAFGVLILLVPRVLNYLVASI